MMDNLLTWLIYLGFTGSRSFTLGGFESSSTLGSKSFALTAARVVSGSARVVLIDHD